jgi:hypothetical protein
MKKIVIILSVSTLIASSCGQTVKKTENQRDKNEQIQYVIKESGFIKLPMEFDVSNLEWIERTQNSTYPINYTSNDSLLFETDNYFYGIIGFLPDTTNYYAFLYFTPADMLTPTIRIMDKNWQKIDEKIICTGGCAGHAQLEVAICYDSVWISTDLRIKSISKVVGTVEIEDSISQVLNICNMRTLEGFIDKYGKINVKESGLIDCNE